MKNFRMLSLSLAVVAFVGLYACNSGTKEVKEVVVEDVIEVVEVEVVDSAGVVDTVVIVEEVIEVVEVDE